MTWTSTRSLVVVASIGVAVPILVWTSRIVYMAATEAPPRLLALDSIVMALGTLGLVALVGQQVHSAVTWPLKQVNLHIESMQRGRYDGAVPAAGPREVRALAASLESLGQDFEQRLADITRSSGVVAIGTVLNGVAHEVANPLAQMKLSAELLRGHAQQQEDAAAMAGLARLTRGLDRLEDVVKTLRHAGDGPGAHDANRLAKAAVIVAQRALLICEFQIELQATQQVECTPRDIVQALVALLENAAESGAKHVRVRTRDGQGIVLIEIEDDGPGVPKEISDAMGHPFTTTKPGHAGLGLSRAFAATTAHGGSLHWEQTTKGTLFVVRLSAA